MKRLPPFPRWVMLLVIPGIIISGCGKDRPRLDPATLPTITPTVATPGAGDGEYLIPLQQGQTVEPDDGRYTFLVPSDWTSVDAEIAEEFWVEPPAGDTDPQVTFNVVRESLNGIENPRQYAEVGQEHAQQIYPSISTISSELVRVGNRPAWRWIFTASVGSGGKFFYQVFIIDGRQGFVLTGSAPKNADPASMTNLFDSIAGSMTFVRG
jgi:hypothetical protein